MMSLKQHLIRVLERYDIGRWNSFIYSDYCTKILKYIMLIKYLNDFRKFLIYMLLLCKRKYFSGNYLESFGFSRKSYLILIIFF